MAALAGGSIPFLIVVVAFLGAVIMGLYTRRGSGIDHHAYRHVYGGAPGADRPCEDFSGADRTWVTEPVVASRWKPAGRRKVEGEPVEPPPSNRMPIRSPVAGPRFR